MRWYIQHIKKEQSELQEVSRLLTAADQEVMEVGLRDGYLWNFTTGQSITNEEEKCIFLGSYSVGRLFQKVNPAAVFDLDSYTYLDWLKFFGEENVLNSDAYIG